jgi:NAD(P)-dependent dehydrogenase (short-subunit alcohol dehydrogenase family)
MNSDTATHNSPRTWFLTSAFTPLAVRLIRLLLSHGDFVAACLPPHELDHDDRSAEYRQLIAETRESGRADREGWKDRLRSIKCDGRVMGQCGAAVAEAKEVFGRIDILLCCSSEGTSTTQQLGSLGHRSYTRNSYNRDRGRALNLTRNSKLDP